MINTLSFFFEKLCQFSICLNIFNALKSILVHFLLLLVPNFILNLFNFKYLAKKIGYYEN